MEVELGKNALDKEGNFIENLQGRKINAGFI